MADLKIKIIGTLDSELSKTEINKKISTLQGQIDKLKLTIQIDEKVSKSLSDFSKAMENHKKIAEDLNRVIREEKVVTKEADGVIREKIKQHLKSGEIIEKEIERINKKNKATQQEKVVTGQLIDELDKLGRKQKEITKLDGKGNPTGSSQKYRDNFTDTTYNANKNGQLTSTRVVENLDQQRKAVDLLNQQLLKLKQTGELSDKTLIKMGNAINSAKSIAEIDKIRNRLNTLDTAVKTRQNNKELEKQLELYKRNAEIQSKTLQSTHGKSVNTTELQKYLQSVKDLNVATPQLQHRMRQLALDFREVSGAARDSSRSNMTVLEAFRTAMVKFPVWMAATTAFYGSLNALKGSVGIIIDVDTRLTNLKKVMDEDTNFGRIMENANLSAQKFGKTLTEVLDAYTEFARQGYKEEDLINLGEAGLITSNVGEVSSQKAAEYLTSAMVQFNLETKESMKVIDAWNNVSNRNATTVEKLAQGMAKAGATANAFSLDMDELNAMIGTVTAATKQSGNEVGNFVKSALPRLLSKPAQDALQMLNIDFMDQKTGDMRHVMDIYEEVAQKVQNISKAEKAVVMEGLAGKFHISRMTAFLDNFELYRKMLDDSRNSEGSASKENQEYMKSLQARIALMKVSLEEIALSLGKAFLTEGFIQTLEIIKTLSHGFAGLASVVGGLPLILSTAGIAALLLSKNMKLAIIESTLMTKVFATLRIEASLLKTALASIGVGAGLVLFGFALEFLLKKMGEAREKAEELKRKNRELVDSYNEHRKDIQSLTAQYEKLDKKIRSGVFDAKDLEKYKNVTNELASLMPSLVQGEDEYGNKIIGSNEVIKSKIALLEKQAATQEKLDTIQKRQDTEDAYKTNKEDLSSSQSNLDNFFFTDDNKTNFKDIESAYKRLEEFQNKIASGEKLNIIEKGELKNLESTINSFESLSADVEGYKLAYQQSVMDMIDMNVKLDDSTGKTTKSLINDFTTFVATSEGTDSQITKVMGNVLNAVKSDDFTKTLENYSSAFKQYQDSINKNADPKEVEEYRDKAKTAFETVKEALLKLADGKGGLNESDLNALSAQLDGVSNSALLSSIDFDKLSKSTGKSAEELKAALLLAPDVEGMYTDIGDEAGDAADQIDELTKALEAANKQYDDSVSKIEDLSKILNGLIAGEGISDEGISELAKNYPELLAYINDEVALREHLTKIIDDEKDVAYDAMIAKLSNNEEFFTQAKKDNTDYFNKLAANYEVDLKNATTLAQLKYQIDAKLIDKLGNVWADFYDVQSMSFTTMGKEMLANMSYAQAVASPELKMISDYQQRMKELSDTMRSFTASSGFSAGITSAGNATYKSTEKNTKATKEFNEALEKLNLEIAKQQKLQNQYPKTSKQYQDAVKNEIKLLQTKKKLLADQSKSLSSQISSGSFTSSSSAVSTSTSTQATGSSTAAQIWNFFRSKGFSDSIVAGIMGNLKLESGLNPNAVNRSSGASGIAQWLGGRKTGLQNYANSMGTSWNDLQTQLEWLWKELNSSEKKTMNYLQGNQNASASTIAAMFDKLFERSEGTHIPQRQKYANEFLNQFAGTSGSPVVTTTSSGNGDINQAKGDLIQLQQEMLGIDDAIRELNMALVQSVTAEQDRKINSYRDDLAKLDLIQSKFTVQFSEWADAENERIRQFGKQKEYQQQAIDYLNQQYRVNTALTSAQRSQIAEEVLDRTIEIYNLDQAINEATMRLLQTYTQEQDRKIQSYSDDAARIEYYQSLLDETSEAWRKLQSEHIYDLGKQAEYSKQSIDYLEKQIASNKALTEAQRSQFKEELIGRMSEYWQLQQNINDANKVLRESKVNENIASVTKLYDKEIKKLQDKLKLLDEVEKTEDRIKTLKEKQDEIDKAKSDKRFEYINKNGKSELTYDKELVSDLGKEMSELKDQYAKEDKRKSLEDQIAALETKRDTSIENMSKLLETYANKSYSNTEQLQNIMKQFITDLGNMYKGAITLPKHHEGGIVGSVSSGSKLTNLVNKLFNVKPNEQIIKALKGEVMIPPQNIANGFENMRNSISQIQANRGVGSIDQSNHYHLSNFEIVANNPLELLQGLESITRKK